MQRATIIEPEPITEELIVETGAERRGFCISIYMPLISGSSEARQNGIRINNRARQAVELLSENGLKAEQARRTVRPLLEIADEVSSSSSRMAPGLAVFISRDGLSYFGIDRTVSDQSVVGNRFYTRPLLRLLSNPRRAYVLTLSRGAARLWQVRYDEAELVHVSDMPNSLSDFTPFDDPETRLQTYSTGAGASGFHGYGVGEEADEERVASYVRSVRRAVDGFFERRRGLLFLACPEEIASIYQGSGNGSSHPADHIVSGNFDRATGPEIHRLAHELMEEVERTQVAQVDRRLAELTAPVANEALTDIPDIVQAAGQGRISELLIAPEFQAEGIVDPDTWHIRPCAGPGSAECEDLADLAAVLTLRYGGKVHIAGPSQSRKTSQQISAVLRG